MYTGTLSKVMNEGVVDNIKSAAIKAKDTVKKYANKLQDIDDEYHADRIHRIMTKYNDKYGNRQDQTTQPSSNGKTIHLTLWGNEYTLPLKRASLRMNSTWHEKKWNRDSLKKANENLGKELENAISNYLKTARWISSNSNIEPKSLVTPIEVVCDKNDPQLLLFVFRTKAGFNIGIEWNGLKFIKVRELRKK